MEVQLAKKKRGRPVKYELPEPIDPSPEEVSDVVMRARPPKEWQYLKQNPDTQESHAHRAWLLVHKYLITMPLPAFPDQPPAQCLPTPGSMIVSSLIR